MRAKIILVFAVCCCFIFSGFLLGEDPPHVPGRVFVKMEPGVLIDTEGVLTGIPEVDAILLRYGIQKIDVLFVGTTDSVLSRWYKFIFPDTVSVPAIVKELINQPGITYAHPSRLFHMADTVRVPAMDWCFENQWHLEDNEPDCSENPSPEHCPLGGSDIDAPWGWGFFTDPSGR